MLRRLLLLTFLSITASAQWTLHDAHTTADLRGIDNVGGGVAWASGSDGTILRTEDAGIVWQLCAKPPGGEHLDFRAIQAFDNSTAIIMSSGKGDLSRLYKTTDGCQSWKLLFTNPDKDGFFDALLFPFRRERPQSHYPQNGWILGDPVNGRFVLMGTADGGAHWTRVQTADLAAPTPQSGVFAASNSSLLYRPSFITGGPGSAYLYEGDSTCTALEGPTVCMSNGYEFTRTKLPLNGDTASAGAFSIAVSPAGINGAVLVVVGGDYSKPAERKGAAAYFNSYFGGWFAPKTLPGGYRSAVAYDPKADVFIAVGPNGTDVSTYDGHNWRALKPDPKFNDTSDADQHWNAISLPYAVGPHGRIGTLRPSALQTTTK